MIQQFFLGLLFLTGFLGGLYILGWIGEKISPRFGEVMKYRILGGLVIVVFGLTFFTICGVFYQLGCQIFNLK